MNMDFDELWMAVVKILINWKIAMVISLLFGILGLTLWGVTASPEFFLFGVGFLALAALSYWFREDLV